MCVCVENIVSTIYAVLISNQTTFSSPSVSIKPKQDTADSTWQRNCSLTSSSTHTLKVCHASVPPSTSTRVCLTISLIGTSDPPLQVVGGPAGAGELSPDGISALRPHLHGLPRPAADEAAHGPVSEEVQVSPFFFFKFRHTSSAPSPTSMCLRSCFESPV